MLVELAPKAVAMLEGEDNGVRRAALEPISKLPEQAQVKLPPSVAAMLEVEDRKANMPVWLHWKP